MCRIQWDSNESASGQDRAVREFEILDGNPGQCDCGNVSLGVEPRRDQNKVRTCPNAIKSLRFSEEAIDFRHAIQCHFCPAMLLHGGLDLFPQRNGIFWGGG